MSKRRLDKDQLELDLTAGSTVAELERFASPLPTEFGAATVYDFKPKMLVAQASARKARAEKILRTVGLIG